MEETRIFYSTYNRGIGLWTSICCVFASIFGCTSKNLLKKQNNMAYELTNDIMEQAKQSNYTLISEIRIVMQGMLSATATAIGKKANNIIIDADALLAKNDYSNSDW